MKTSPCQAADDFGFVSGLEEKRDRLDQVGAGILDGGALAGDVKLRAKRHESIVFAFDDGGEARGLFHDSSLTRLNPAHAQGRPAAFQASKPPVRLATSRKPARRSRLVAMELR